MICTKTCLIFVIAALTGCVSQLRVRDEAEISRIRSLQTNERIELRYSRVGCHGGPRYEIDFIRRGEDIIAKQPAISHHTTRSRGSQRKEIILSRTDVSQIDQLIDGYREKAWDQKQRFLRGEWKETKSATSIEFLEWTKFRDSQRVATEKFSGDGGVAGNRSNARAISELNAQLQKAR